MATFMDAHTIIGKNSKFIIEEYCTIISVQKNNGCKYLNVWLDKKKDKVFFLIDAINKDSIIKYHNQIDGLIPNEIVQLNNEISRILLNSDQDFNLPSDTDLSEIKVFKHPDYRAYLVTDTSNTRLLQHKIGIYNTYKLLSKHEKIIFKEVHEFGGREIESEKEGYIASFTSSYQALECANSIQEKLKRIAELINFKIGVHGGVPAKNSNTSQNNIIKFTRYLSWLGNDKQIVISSLVHELFTDYEGVNFMDDPDRVRWLHPCEGKFLEKLMDVLTQNWRNSRFDINDFSIKMSMSKSHLYRNCKKITGVSINILLRDYRLFRSLEILNKTDSNISQTAFQTGFSSPSYFAKRFKNKFGIQPTSFLKNSVAT